MKLKYKQLSLTIFLETECNIQGKKSDFSKFKFLLFLKIFIPREFKRNVTLFYFSITPIQWLYNYKN